jgi:hypothetical protein
MSSPANKMTKERKPREPMTDEQKQAMAQKRAATLAAKKAAAPEEKPKAKGKGKKADAAPAPQMADEEKQRARKPREPMTEEAKKAMAEKRKATLAAKKATAGTASPMPEPVHSPLKETEKPKAKGKGKKAAPAPVPTSSRPTLPLHYSEKLMIRYQDANRDQRLPDTTDVACYWDCHPFRGTPCVIPFVIDEGIWRVYGNFCSPECAAAYLFNERLDSNVQWERYALLNRLYAPTSESGVRLAPSRNIIHLFGGPLDVSDFRAVNRDQRMRIDVMTPPMISIIQVMDTKPIDFYDASMKNSFIPWEMDRLNRPGAQGLRLRRTKPVTEKESTLEFCMGIAS